MRDNAVNPNQPKDARGELDVYMAYGYIPLEDDERGTCVRRLAPVFFMLHVFGRSLSPASITSPQETLAYAYNDWAISVFAGILGYTEDVPIFAERALNYRNSFSTEELFMCPRYRVRVLGLPNGTMRAPLALTRVLFSLPRFDPERHVCVPAHLCQPGLVVLRRGR